MPLKLTTNTINLRFNESHHTLMNGVEAIITVWILARFIHRYNKLYNGIGNGTRALKQPCFV